MKKLGFVIPWFGKKISGGAELELKGLAEHLNAAGVEVEILATCVKEFSADWNQNYYPEGVEVVNGIPVRRFRVRKRDTQAFDGVNYKLLNQIPLSSREEEIYAKEMVNSPDLYAYLKEKQEEYGAYIFIPYMFGTTYYPASMMKAMRTWKFSNQYFPKWPVCCFWRSRSVILPIACLI